jgi:O-antigen biosynthesis protein WbqP
MSRGEPPLLAQEAPPSGSWAASPAKRLFDLCVALPLLLALLPVIAALAIAVRLDSPGPAFFSQARVGRGERRFLCRKLRSMHRNTPSVATHLAPAGAATRLGAVLRRLKLDELPQLWNVVRGEMSLVGPRPCLEGQRELVRLRRGAGVYGLRPGVTGLAQVEGVDMSDPARCAALDGRYAETATFTGDLRLILRTVLPLRRA